MRLLVVDNFDSFTNNIVNFLRGLTDGLEVDVVRNDQFEVLEDAAYAAYDGIIISPGPGNPADPADLGISKTILDQETRPILGVCLGHQAMVIAAGGAATLAPEPMHGRTSVIHSSQTGLFKGLPEQLSVMRYHSWTVSQSLPQGFVCDAWSEDGLVMAVRDTRRPRWGVQFHPESICTEFGRTILQNFLREVAAFGDGVSVRLQPFTPAKPTTRKFMWHDLGPIVSPIALVEAQSGEAQRRPMLLESSLVHAGRSRFTFVEVPDVADRSVTFSLTDGLLREFTGPVCVRASNTSIFDFLEAKKEPSALIGGPPPFDFVGGFIGWFGYELKAETLGVTSPDASTPDAAFREVTQFFAVDHAEGRLYACLSLPLRATEAQKEAGIRMLAAIADRAARHVAKATSPVSSDPVTFAFRHDPLNYIDLIRACRDEIKAGESYELCLTNIISTEARFDAWAFYKLLRERNPSIYGGYLNIGGTEVASSSPERFLRLKRDNILESKPIKGTAPRGTTEAMDRTLKQELRDSEKERAENIMIVDLVRHDFSGVAVPGSIEVPNLCNIESYPAVHQMVSTVQARLRPDLSTADALRACFPGGSMTGAPKIRSVQILDRLENGPRGVYSGALGWVGYDGQLDLSIVIRTLVKQGGVSSIGCGGAITYLSDPAAELDEIMTKSRALVRTLSELITGDPENHVFIPSKQQDPTAPDTAFVRAE